MSLNSNKSEQEVFQMFLSLAKAMLVAIKLPSFLDQYALLDATTLCLRRYFFREFWQHLGMDLSGTRTRRPSTLFLRRSVNETVLVPYPVDCLHALARCSFLAATLQAA